MRPEEVPAELVEAAELALADRCNDEHENGRGWCGCPDEGDLRAILAAVLPLAQAAARKEALSDAADARRGGRRAQHVTDWLRAQAESEGSPS